MRLLLSSVCSLLTAWSLDLKADDPKPIVPPQGHVPLELLQLGTADSLTPYAFLMDKASRTLSVWRQKDQLPELVELHPADIGREPGVKTSVNDHRTPEGIYFFRQKLENQTLNLDNISTFTTMAFTTDYPNFFDRLAKKTGSGIWLHAIPDNVSLFRGSRGCIVVRNSILKGLGSFIRLGQTPIIMSEKSDYVTPEIFLKKRTDILNWLEAWRSHWETKNLNEYMNDYDDGFSAMSMDKYHWRNFKKSLIEKYTYIKVQIKEPTIYVSGNNALIRFYQIYNSDKNSDFGEKTLYINHFNTTPKIVSEVWSKDEDQTLAKKLSSTRPETTEVTN